MDENKRGVMYLRVSTDMQVEGYSLQAQQSAIERYANAYNIDIVDCYTDEGKSGKSIENRIKFQKMLSDIETGKLPSFFILIR